MSLPRIRVFRRYLTSTFVWPGRLMPFLFQPLRTLYRGEQNAAALRTFIARAMLLTHQPSGFPAEFRERLQQTAMPTKMRAL